MTFAHFVEGPISNIDNTKAVRCAIRNTARTKIVFKNPATNIGTFTLGGDNRLTATRNPVQLPPGAQYIDNTDCYNDEWWVISSSATKESLYVREEWMEP